MTAQSTGPIERLVLAVDAIKSRVGRSGQAIVDAFVVLVAAVVATALAFLLGMTTPVRFAETLTQDLRMVLTAPPNATPMTIVKMDDTAIRSMRDASPCHCLSPIDKAWLAQLVVDLDHKGVRAIALDYLIDTWRSPEEARAFAAAVAGLHVPLIAVVDPALKPGTDYPIIPGVHYADARALITDDYDDVVRRYDPKPGALPSMASEIVRQIGGRPLDHPFIMHYRRPDPSVSAENAGAVAPSYSAAYIAAIPDELLKGRIAFVGRTTRAVGAVADTPKEDMHMTPLRFLAGNYAGTPGVEIHANAVSQMMDGDQLAELNIGLVLTLILLASLCGALLGRATLSWWLSSVLIMGGLVFTATLALGTLYYIGLLLPVTTPALGFVFGFFVLSRLAAVRLQSERAFYSSTLERYLSPSVIDKIVDGSEPLKLGAHERDITVMITDLENFSVLVASTPSQDFARVMNDYFGGLTELLWKHEALIDKMTGDGIIAIFGAPVAQPDHADRAVACALEIDAFTEAFRQRSVAEGLKVGRTRIGLNSGEGLVGNFGGDRRFNYTAYGQVVVIAARLEAANKALGTRVLMSAETWSRIPPVAGGRSMGEIELKGVEQKVAAWAIAG